MKKIEICWDLWLIILLAVESHGSKVSITPIMAMGCRQCLPLSNVQLKGKHCRKPHCHNGVVDTFGHDLSQADKSNIRVSSFPKLFLNVKFHQIYNYTKKTIWHLHTVMLWLICRHRYIGLGFCTYMKVILTKNLTLITIIYHTQFQFEKMSRTMKKM
jgi:hypothetical protein